MTKIDFMLNPATRLEWKSFFALTKFLFKLKSSRKKDWERKADKVAQI